MHSSSSPLLSINIVSIASIGFDRCGKGVKVFDHARGRASASEDLADSGVKSEVTAEVVLLPSQRILLSRAGQTLRNLVVTHHFHTWTASQESWLTFETSHRRPGAEASTPRQGIRRGRARRRPQADGKADETANPRRRCSCPARRLTPCGGSSPGLPSFSSSYSPASVAGYRGVFAGVARGGDHDGIFKGDFFAIWTTRLGLALTRPHLRPSAFSSTIPIQDLTTTSSCQSSFSAIQVDNLANTLLSVTALIMKLLQPCRNFEL